MLKFNNKKYVCHLDLAMDMIRGKWKAVLLCHLIDGPKDSYVCIVSQGH